MHNTTENEMHEVGITKLLDSVHIWYSEEQNVLEIGPVSNLMQKNREAPILLGPLEKANLNH
jgi:hypothetical protein